MLGSWIVLVNSWSSPPEIMRRTCLSVHHCGELLAISSCLVGKYGARRRELVARAVYTELLIWVHCGLLAKGVQFILIRECLVPPRGVRSTPVYFWNNTFLVTKQVFRILFWKLKQSETGWNSTKTGWNRLKQIRNRLKQVETDPKQNPYTKYNKAE